MVFKRKSRPRNSESVRAYGHSRVQRSSKAQKRTLGAQRVKPQRPASTTDWTRVRIAAVGILLGLAWCVLWARAYYVQIMDGPELAAMATRQHEVSEYVSGERGQIFDRKGRLLAKSVAIKSVFVRPLLVKDVEATSRILSETLGLARSDIREKLSSNEKHVWIARQIGDKASANIRDAKLDGVYLTTEYGRLYPNKQLAGQLLGFVGTDDKGLEGLESSFNERLVGRTSKVMVHRDATGHMLYLNTEVNDEDARGHDVRLTIDAHIQFVAEEALSRTVTKYQANWGGCLVIHVPDGEILAWAEAPAFNPNAYLRYSPQRWRNRLSMDAYEPGSCAKPFTVAAAMQEGLCNPETLYYCENGRFRIDRRFITDVSPREWLPVAKVLQYSNNVGAAKIALDVGAQKLHDYLSRLGFGNKVGLPLPGESKGILRPPGIWEQLDLASAGFGQGFSVTALQLAKAYLCLANFGVSIPLRISLDPVIESQPSGRIFSANVAASVLRMLQNVVEEDGTGKRARIQGIHVGGKTSTAQKASARGGYGSKVVASFTGLFPIDKPEYLILVVVDEPEPQHYGGVVAAPVFKEVAEKTLAYEGNLPEPVRQVLFAEAESQKEIETFGKKANKCSPSNFSLRRAVSPECRIASNKIPDVVGLSVRSAMEAFVGQGVVPHFKGAGTIVSRQQPTAGGNWSEENRTNCILWLSDGA